MTHLISFETALFDLRKERKNPINPIWGSSILLWLRDALTSRVDFTAPSSEDWGWYSMATFEGCEYLVGACAMGGPNDPPPLEWLIQIHKQRTLKEKLLGRNRMAANDPLAALLRATLEAEPAFAKVELRIE
jgi:hypothetical protein